MTKTVSTAACAIAIGFATAALMAQAAPANQRTSSPEHRVIVTGCLTQAPPIADASVGGGSPVVPAFLVTDAALSLPESASGTASGGPGVTAPAASARSYRVVGNPALLQEHVGERVAVLGMLEQPSTSADAGGSERNVPVLRLESGKTIAAVCGKTL